MKLKLDIDIQSLELGLQVFQGLERDEVLESYYNSKGIQFLKRHLKRFGGYELTIEDFMRFHQNLSLNNIFTHSIVKAKEKMKQIQQNELVEFKSKINGLRTEVEKLVNQYSPPSSEVFEVKIYLLFGIRGTGITLGNEIAIDLVSDELYEGQNLSNKKLSHLLAHEVHHIIVEWFYLKKIDTIKNQKVKERYSFKENLLSEGMATYYFTPELILSQQNIKKLNDPHQMDQEIDNLEKVLQTNDFLLEDLERQYFDSNNLGYLIGFYMVKMIEEKLGSESVIQLIEDLNIFDVYKKAKAQ